MPYENNIDNITTTELKSQLIEMGIYEDDMGIKEMRDLFKTIKQSEQSASAEKEYRETLYKANKNCTELLELIQERKSPDAGYSLRSKENYKKVVNSAESDEASNDTFFPTHHEKKDKNLDDKNNTESDEETISTVNEKSTITDKKLIKTPITKEKTEKLPKNIDVFLITDAKREPLKHIEKQFDNVIEPFYCRPDIRNMPVYLAVNAIKKFHETLLSQHRIIQSDSVNLVGWGKGICIASNKETNEELAIQSDRNTDNYCLRSRRQNKRKIYTEFFTDDEDKISNKKSKDNVKPSETEVDLNVAKQDFDFYSYQDKIFDNLRDSGTVSSPQKRFHRSKDPPSSDEEHSTQIQVSAIVHHDATESTPVKRKSGTINQTSSKKLVSTNNSDNVTVCGDTIIEYIDDDISSPTLASKRKPVDNYESIQEEDCIIDAVTDDSKFVRRRIIPPNPLRDKMSQRSEQKIRNLSRRRNKNPNSITKPESQKTNTEKTDDEEVDDIFGEITPKKFYGKKNDSKENVKSRTQPSRTRNISPLLESEYLCPICDQYFPSSVIQEHASGCTRIEVKKLSQENGGTLCCICNKFLLHNVEDHLEECKRSQMKENV